MTPFHLVTLVEGVGDVQAVGDQLRRLRPMWSVARPLRTKRGSITSGNLQLQRHLGLAMASIELAGGFGAALVLIDADKQCPRQLQDDWRKQCPSLKHPIAFVAAKRTFESWILAGTPELDLPAPETVSPKFSVKKLLRADYNERLHQTGLASRIEPERAKTRSASFAYFLRQLDNLQSGAAANVG